MNDIPAYFTGNLTRDPELRVTPGGRAVASLGIAVTPRRYNAKTKQYEDGTTTFVDANVWGSQAEYAVESLTKGSRVIVTGRWVTRTFTSAGTEVRKLEVLVDELGPSLRWAKATVDRVKPTAAEEPPLEEEPAA
jgi:single-strand DNA-binding protein